VRAEPPQIHDQRLYSAELRLAAEWGFAEGWSVTAMAPLRLVRTTIQYENLQGQPITLDYENIHHRNETLFGLADPWLTAARGFGFDSLDIALSLRAGVTIPLGQTQPDPFLLERQGKAHEHIQLGTGTFDPVLGLELKKGFRAPFNGAVLASGTARVVLYENARGYQAGSRFVGEAAVAGKIGYSGFTWRAGALLYRENAERWASSPVTDEGNLGRTEVLIDLGMVWALGNEWTLAATVRVPVFSRTEGEQLSYPALGEVFGSKLLHVHAGDD
jgi:hypothetical protein